MSLRLRVLGAGEISTVFAVEDAAARDAAGQGAAAGKGTAGGGEETLFALSTGPLPRSALAFKRMPLFDTLAQVERYLAAFREYHQLLTEAGLEVPAYGNRVLRHPDGKYVVYDLQARLPAESIGNVVIRSLNPGEARVALRAVLVEIAKVWRFNETASPGRGLRVALDAQISNWAFFPYPRPAPGAPTYDRLVYVDTSTPLYRRGGKEVLEAGIFIASLPRPLRWLIRRFFLQEVLDRYYDLRSVVRDLVANIIKEGRGDLVPSLVEEAQRFLAAEVAPRPRPLTLGEVRSYYRQDRLIWVIFQNSRRLARFARALIGRPLDYRLPTRAR